VFEKIRKTNASMKEYSVHMKKHLLSASFP